MAYVPRLTAPASTDLRWIQVNSGGYNQCVYGAYGAPSVLPNCTGYVHGRCMEIGGLTTDNIGLSFGNGNAYYNGSSSDWVHDSEPSLGAVACWDGEYGHVAIVEEIIDANTIVLSESSYSGPPVVFRTVTGYRHLGWRPINDVIVFQGFLKNPYVDDTPTPPTPPTPIPSPYKPLSLAEKFMTIASPKIKYHR